MNRIRKGDTVEILSGKDRGKRGKILAVIPQRGTALVERLNLAKHFDRRTRADQPGGIIEREAPIRMDKLALACPRCGKATRVGFKLTHTAGSASVKQRVCNRCHDEL